jgi:hypothetical protein
MRDMASGSGDPAYTASMSEADYRFREALRIDLQRLLGEGIVVLELPRAQPTKVVWRRSLS